MWKRTSRGRRQWVPSLVVIAALAGCSGAADEAPVTDVPGLDLSAELDENSGAVILPYDRLSPSFVEADRLTTAASFALAECAADSGVTFTPIGDTLDAQVYASEQYFGPWTIDQAETFGFVTPQSRNDMVANGIDGAVAGESSGAEAVASANDALSDADWTIIDGCGSEDAAVREFSAATVDSGPWSELLLAAGTRVVDDPRAQPVIDELTACFADEGLEPMEDTPWLPEGADPGVLSAGQIELALTVVRCKESVGFTQRMADIDASLQAPILRDHAAELIERREALDAALEHADAVIAAHAP